MPRGATAKSALVSRNEISAEIMLAMARSCDSRPVANNKLLGHRLRRDIVISPLSNALSLLDHLESDRFLERLSVQVRLISLINGFLPITAITSGRN
jgi:hypothetical protein